MPTITHFIDIGLGNMVLIQAANGDKFVLDWNITNDNQTRVLGYVARQIGEGTPIDAFICSHGDADDMRGVAKLHQRIPIQSVWDSDYPGTTTNTSEYILERLTKLAGEAALLSDELHVLASNIGDVANPRGGVRGVISSQQSY